MLVSYRLLIAVADFLADPAPVLDGKHDDFTTNYFVDYTPVPYTQLPVASKCAPQGFPIPGRVFDQPSLDSASDALTHGFGEYGGVFLYRGMKNDTKGHPIIGRKPDQQLAHALV